MTSSLLRILAAGAHANTAEGQRRGAGAADTRRWGESRPQAGAVVEFEDCRERLGRLRSGPGEAGRRLDVSSEAMMLGLASLARGSLSNALRHQAA
jgi:hypothetical protein